MLQPRVRLLAFHSCSVAFPCLLVTSPWPSHTLPHVAAVPTTQFMDGNVLVHNLSVLRSAALSQQSAFCARTRVPALTHTCHGPTQDFGDVVVHLFTAEQREYYNLEDFYATAEEVELPFGAPAGAGAAAGVEQAGAGAGAGTGGAGPAWTTKI